MESAEKIENISYSREEEIRFLVTQIVAERIHERANRLKPVVEPQEKPDQPVPFYYGF